MSRKGVGSLKMMRAKEGECHTEGDAGVARPLTQKPRTLVVWFLIW
jgi:hypothetical protein